MNAIYIMAYLLVGIPIGVCVSIYLYSTEENWESEAPESVWAGVWAIVLIILWPVVGIFVLLYFMGGMVGRLGGFVLKRAKDKQNKSDGCG